jgi:hypothetical protein
VIQLYRNNRLIVKYIDGDEEFKYLVEDMPEIIIEIIQPDDYVNVAEKSIRMVKD